MKAKFVESILLEVDTDKKILLFKGEYGKENVELPYKLEGIEINEDWLWANVGYTVKALIIDGVVVRAEKRY